MRNTKAGKHNRTRHGPHPTHYHCEACDTTSPHSSRVRTTTFDTTCLRLHSLVVASSPSASTLPVCCLLQHCFGLGARGPLIGVLRNGGWGVVSGRTGQCTRPVYRPPISRSGSVCRLQPRQ